VSGDAKVFLVDDGPDVRRALERMLRAEGYDLESFGSADEFLASLPDDAWGCCVLDVAMPGLDGLALQARLAAGGAALEVVFLTGRGDIPMSVRAMKSGAVDFLTKPVRRDDLVRAVTAALTAAQAKRGAAQAAAGLRARLARLTPREREVMLHVIAGKLNKVIAAELGTSEHTVKVHRGRVMEKLAVDSVAELVHAARELGLPPAP
jgi:FixJ family two-component response regulator